MIPVWSPGCLAARAGATSPAMLVVVSAVLFVISFAAAAAAYRPMGQLIRWEEGVFATVLRDKLLLDVRPRTATILTGLGVGFLALFGYGVSGSFLGAVFGAAAGALLPVAILRYLARRRLARLEGQLVGGVQTLASGVRAGLNLVQSMQLVARDGPVPLRQEFAHLLREYEYGVSLDEAMNNAAGRIGSGDFRLLFSALHTHRERGGDVGQTLDRIAESIREIQRLESRAKALTAQGRATARWLGAMPGVVMLIFYLLVDSEGMISLFTEAPGKLILVGIVVLNIIGFLWIKKIVSIDI